MKGRAAIRAVLFDKDGTLVDFRSTWLPAYERLVAGIAAGDAALAERLLSAGGYDRASGAIDPRSPLAAGTNAEIAALWAPLAGIADVGAFAQWLDDEFQAHASTGLKPVTDLGTLFRRLRGRGLSLGIATNDSEGALRRQLPLLGVESLVDFVAGYDSGHGGKPGPGMVRAFCRSVGVGAGEVAVVGDSLHDLEMGREAGAGLLVGVLTGASGRELLALHADLVIDSVAELETVLT